MRKFSVFVLIAALCLAAFPVFAQTAVPTVPVPELTQEITPEATAEMTHEATSEMMATPVMEMTAESTPEMGIVRNINPWNLTAADPLGFVRFAHTAADAPAVDVYVAELGDVAVVEDLEFGEVSDFYLLPEGSYTYVVRAAGSDATDDVLASMNWDVQRNSSWLITFAGLNSNISLQMDPINLLRSEIPENMSRVRLVNFVSGAAPLTVTSNTGDAFGTGLDWIGVFDAELTPGTYNLSVAGDDGTAMLTDTAVDLQPGSLTTLLLVGAADGSRPIEIVAFNSPADMSRVQFVNNGSAAVDIFVRPGDTQLVSSLGPGETSEWVSVPSGAVTFVTYAPGTGPTGQELGAWIGAVEPLRDLVITWNADNTADEGEPTFSPDMSEVQTVG